VGTQRSAGPNAENTLRITVLVDNKAREGLTSEHGLSLWIESREGNLLFDTGAGAALPLNAQALGIDLCSASALVLSHGHYDHTGGVTYVLKKCPGIQVYCHPALAVQRFSLRRGSPKPIHIQQPAASQLRSLVPDRLILSSKPTSIFENVGVTGFIPRHTDFENAGGPFYFDKEGTSPDPVEDDMALWVQTACGPVVCVGCCHAGLINTLRAVESITGAPRIRAVIGGFHLRDSSEERLQRTVRELEKFDPELIVPCHCTGRRAVALLKSKFGDKVVEGSAGLTLDIRAGFQPTGPRPDF